ncbi:MAG: type II secretion system protein [Planctomycetota bacterium]|jgi:prepilin-type N-terminal cleavage/methylation domain-containing protein
MKKKGFTLIELLVVISIIAMLLAILMPALNKVKKIAQRVVCGTNLKGLGTAQVVYAADYDDEYTVQGGSNRDLVWTNTTDGWQQLEGTMPWSGRTNITVGASLYLLVREADVSAKSFVCPSSAEQEFDGKNDFDRDIVELFDFGHVGWDDTTGPENCVSYSYHLPYEGGTGAGSGAKGRRAADGSRSASFAMMSDQNPFFDLRLTKGGLASDYSNAMDIVGPVGGPTNPTTTDDFDGLDKVLYQIANAQPHDRESQNVLFGDGHTENEKETDVGVKYDNIYTRQTDATEAGRRKGVFPSDQSSFIPYGGSDSVLVNDGELCPATGS